MVPMNFKQCWMAKLDRALFSMIQYCKITVWFASYKKLKSRKQKVQKIVNWQYDAEMFFHKPKKNI